MTFSVLALFATYLAYEQLWYGKAVRAPGGGRVPGPAHVTPLLGGIVDMVLHPYEFWERQRQWALSVPSGMSYNSLVGKMILFVTEVDTCREVLAVNDPKRMLMTLHPSAKNILGPNNLAFMHGPEHKNIRKSFMHLFTRKALGTYVEIQDQVIREHLDLFLKRSKSGPAAENGSSGTASSSESSGAKPSSPFSSLSHQEIRDWVRDMNQETSQRVFLGPYLPPGPEKEAFGRNYRNITDGFLAFPLCVPGTAVWRARQSRFKVLAVLLRCANDALAAARRGDHEPCCLLDYWCERCLKEAADAEARGAPAPPHTTPLRIADAVLDFLFASQDASTASLTWSVTLTADHPEVLRRVRLEQAAVRGADRGATVTGDVLRRMRYTRQVAKEVLRLRAPAPMVPQLALADYRLKDGYVVPKGTLVMPSLNAVTLSGFPNAEAFDPDRFSDERKEELLYGKHLVTFGHGPHYCVGKEYAINQLTCFLALLASACDYDRKRTDRSDQWIYLPTIYPADALVAFAPRTEEEHAADVAEANASGLTAQLAADATEA